MKFIGKKPISKLLKWTLRLVAVFAIVWITIIGVYAGQARKKDGLKLWHKVKLTKEFKSRDYNPTFTFKEYQKKEDALFEELQKKVYDKVEQANQHQFSRYTLKSPCNPDSFPQNYNRSYELVPKEIKGGILLIHGLTDSPYSMKHLAQIFYKKGFYVLALRMPGHGTAPSSLADVAWKDWHAAAKIGASHIAGKIDPDRR
jgi:hypothetical protein